MGAIILNKLVTLSAAVDSLQARIGAQSGITIVQADEIAAGLDAVTGRIDALLS